MSSQASSSSNQKGKGKAKGEGKARERSPRRSSGTPPRVLEPKLWITTYSGPWNGWEGLPENFVGNWVACCDLRARGIPEMLWCSDSKKVKAVSHMYEALEQHPQLLSTENVDTSDSNVTITRKLWDTINKGMLLVSLSSIPNFPCVVYFPKTSSKNMKHF